MSDPNKDNFMQTLPSVLANDAGMQPLGETASRILEIMWAQVDLPAIYTRIDELPEELLDILAKDFKVDWYDYNHSLETKRLVIKDSFYVHKHLGTVGAVRRALSDIWPSFSLEEWFDYGGDPYHFRVAIADNDFTVAKREQAIKAINLTKNVRSWLDDIYAQVIGDIVIVESAQWCYVDYLVASDIELTNANDIADWTQPEFDTVVGQVDITRVGVSYVAPVGNTLVIPSAITVIEEEAYAGIDAEVVICPDDCTTIKSLAFSDCPNLRTISIGSATVSIANNAFSGSDSDLTIQTPEGSYAETYAAQHGYHVIH
ncbi:MAG: phage tail protein I [Aristaeellaceae bacterium]